MNAHDGELHPALWTELLQLGMEIVRANQTRPERSESRTAAVERSGQEQTPEQHTKQILASALVWKPKCTPSRLRSKSKDPAGFVFGEGVSVGACARENEQSYAPIVATVFGERYRWSPLELRKWRVREPADTPLDVSFQSLCERLRSL